MTPALLLAAAMAQAGAVEQIGPPVPPAATVAAEQAEGRHGDLAIPQLPSDARAVPQPLPAPRPTASASDDATIGYSAILGPSSVRQPGDAPPELGPLTVADFGAIVAATNPPRPAADPPSPAPVPAPRK